MSVGHFENFPVASVLVPARIRPAVVAVYRFARAADDIADEGDASAGERLSALDAFGQALDAIGRGETPALAPFPELAAAVRGHGLPLRPLHDLLSAFRQDVTTTRYLDLPALLDYCAHSAASERIAATLHFARGAAAFRLLGRSAETLGSAGRRWRPGEERRLARGRSVSRAAPRR